MKNIGIPPFTGPDDHPAFCSIPAKSSLSGNVLIIGDPTPGAGPLRVWLEDVDHQAFEIVEAATATDALCLLGSGEFDIAFVGETVGDTEGNEIIRQAGGRLSPTPMVYVSASRGDDAHEADIPGGATDMILAEEISPLVLRRVIRYARSSHAAARQLIVNDYRHREIAEGASAANHQKSRFLALMSHEFRTPLNAILGFSEAIDQEIFGKLGGDGAGRYKEYIGHIHSSGTHLLSLINDLLDISKIEAGKQEIHPEPVTLGDVVDDVIRMVAPQAEAHDVTVVLKSGEASDMAIFADRRLLTQAMLNVVANAVKFSGAGDKVSIRVRREGRNVVIVVSDQGCGISEEELARVLEPFHQAKSLETRQGRGTGLGLPLSHSIMGLHQGGLEVSSEEGRGTTVSLWMPCDLERGASQAA